MAVMNNTDEMIDVARDSYVKDVAEKCQDSLAAFEAVCKGMTDGTSWLEDFDAEESSWEDLVKLALSTLLKNYTAAACDKKQEMGKVPG